MSLQPRMFVPLPLFSDETAKMRAKAEFKVLDSSYYGVRGSWAYPLCTGICVS
ncbi:predicted protein [Plenodomus lingam JN3]|uniref:Predicted protein n=1 Tax=Leptosphaeria maculans (strain JN3 / isolate v23.1.3 / race Av1-4-5-6-7-8) TaxID=985895 RepID=E4ZLX0_LEPMJ|nr:predicted protein [Plenodomus lingam JN3]CBX92800.1 predicted protein [Plenodomus lingam JN3]